MGSVTRRFKRNIMAKNAAVHTGVNIPPIRLGGRVVVPGGNEPLPHYRTWMLRYIWTLRDRRKRQHDLYQKQQGRKSKVFRFFGGFKKSWLRRMLEKVFPSLRKEVREEAKAERQRKQRERHHAERPDQRRQRP